MKLYKLTVVMRSFRPTDYVQEEKYYYSKAKAEEDRLYLALTEYKDQDVDISISHINTEDEVK